MDSSPLNRGNSGSHLYRAAEPAWKGRLGTATPCGRCDTGKYGLTRSSTTFTDAYCVTSSIWLRDLTEHGPRDYEVGFVCSLSRESANRSQNFRFEARRVFG